MIVALDVDYRDDHAIAAAVCLDDFDDVGPFPALPPKGAEPGVLREHTTRVAPIADYEPGAFYRRELPCLLAILAALPTRPAIVIIDGYVWLARDRAGLGARLYDALLAEQAGVVVIGVAKTAFHGNDAALPVLRGESQRPVFVTSAGLAVEEAAAAIARMSGAHRLPTALSRVDRLCREASR